MTSCDVAVLSDPWTATEAEAHAADRAAGSPTYGPLARWHIAQAIARRRGECEAPDGGTEVMKSIAECLLHGLMPPPWLADAFTHRHQLVSEAHVATWDEAFGRPWPKHTRLEIVRRNRERIRLVHAAVWKFAMRHRRWPLRRQLFDEVALQLDTGISGTQVERLYYVALKLGMANVAELRSAATTAKQPAPIRLKDEDGHGSARGTVTFTALDAGRDKSRADVCTSHRP